MALQLLAGEGCDFSQLLVFNGRDILEIVKSRNAGSSHEWAQDACVAF